jgi:hypothetical protein
VQLVRQVQLVYREQQDNKVSLEILQLFLTHRQQVQIQVMLGLMLRMEKLMFIMIHTGLKQARLL